MSLPMTACNRGLLSGQLRGHVRNKSDGREHKTHKALRPLMAREQKGSAQWMCKVSSYKEVSARKGRSNDHFQINTCSALPNKTYTPAWSKYCLQPSPLSF